MSAPTHEEALAEIARLQRRLERERTARRDAEAIAESGLRDLYKKQQEIQLLESIATAANQTTAIQDALQFAVTTVCQFTGWVLGHAYMYHGGEQNRLVSTGIWHPAVADSAEQFRQVTENTEFVAGVGLPGQVLETGAPVWLVNVADNPNFPRGPAASRAGLRTAFAFPVLAGKDVVAVLEFFADRELEPDPTLLRLLAQVGTQLGRVVERKRNEEQLIHDASHDALTGLPNRALFLDRLQRAVAHNKRHPEYLFAVLFIDLDRFKVVNDSLGHLAGDDLIVQVGMRLLKTLRRHDMVSRADAGASNTVDTLARLGGDEFTILLDDIRDLTDAVRIAERIQELLKQPFRLEGQNVHVSASIGIASSATRYTSADEVLRDADLAMYRAKSLGKARSEVYDQNMHKMAVEHLKLETDLRLALQNNEFVLHYQPIVDLLTEEIAGFEALVRWQRAPDELVSPADFIQIAEDMGLIVPLGLWVLREACQTTHRWHRQFPRRKPLTISINVSARQFAEPDLVAQVTQILNETGIDPETVRLEITESVTMGNVEQTIRVLTELKTLGVRLSIDDFGTGYSSLSYLHSLPLDILKIDRSFISRMDQGESLQIVETIMNLAKSLRMDVVAEGTETKSHVDHLKSLGCEFGQGYFFSRPVPASSIERLLSAKPTDGL